MAKTIKKDVKRGETRKPKSPDKGRREQKIRPHQYGY